MTDPREPGVGRLLAEQRERAGLTQRDLASIAGLAPATIAAAELGEEPRAGTLESCLSALPCLGVRRLLGGAQARPAPASAGMLELFRATSGLGADRVTLTLTCGDAGLARMELAVEGLRSSVLDPDDPASIRQLVRAVHRGSPEVLRDVPWPSPGTEASLDLRDGAVTHSYRLPARFDDGGLTYRRAEPLALDAARLDPDEGTGLFHAPGHPVGELVLALRPAPGRGAIDVRHEARPAAIGSPLPLPPLPRRLLRLRADDPPGEVRAEILGPLPHLAHRLTWTDAPRTALPDLPEAIPADLPLALRLRRAREREGLSVRALAALMETGAATISGAENGRDVRLSTLRAYLRALPGLDPDELLPDPRPTRIPGRREGWELLRALHGMQAALERKSLRVAKDGSAAVTYSTHGLRRTSGEGPLVVRYGADPLARGQVVPPSLIEPQRAAKGAEPALRTRLLRLLDGLTIHQLAFSAESAERGVSYDRRVELGKAFAATREEAQGPLGSGVDGTTFTAAFPVESLEIEALLPPGLRVLSVRALAWPPLVVPRDLGAALTERLHPEGLQARWEARSRRASLVVAEPLLGIRYVLAWSIG